MLRAGRAAPGRASLLGRWARASKDMELVVPVTERETFASEEINSITDIIHNYEEIQTFLQDGKSQEMVKTS